MLRVSKFRFQPRFNFYKKVKEEHRMIEVKIYISFFEAKNSA